MQFAISSYGALFLSSIKCSNEGVLCTEFSAPSNPIFDTVKIEKKTIKV